MKLDLVNHIVLDLLSEFAIINHAQDTAIHTIVLVRWCTGMNESTWVKLIDKSPYDIQIAPIHGIDIALTIHDQSLASFAWINSVNTAFHSSFCTRSTTSVMKACAISLRASASLTPRLRR